MAMKYYKFLKRNTYCTLHMNTELPPPGQSAPSIRNIRPSGSAGKGSGIGYHAYSERILPFITEDAYNENSDLWVVRIHGNRIPYQLVRDKPASVFPPHPMECVVTESIELVEKVPFIVNEGRLTLL